MIKEFESGNIERISTRKKKSVVRIEDNFTIASEGFSNARAKNLPVSGTLLHEKAKEMAEKIIIFKASTGWLMSFFNEHNIAIKQIF